MKGVRTKGKWGDSKGKKIQEQVYLILIHLLQNLFSTFSSQYKEEDTISFMIHDFSKIDDKQID